MTVGQVLSTQDLQQAIVSTDSGLDVIPAAAQASVLGQLVAYSLPAGAVLSRSRSEGTQPGAVHGRDRGRVEAGPVPPDVAPGARVAVLVTPGTAGISGAGSGGTPTGSRSGSVPSWTATVTDVQPSTQGMRPRWCPCNCPPARWAAGGGRPGPLQHLVIGGIGAGKTTLLRALAAAIPPWERVSTIEDVFELGLDADERAHPDAPALQAREANIEGAGEITQAELVRTALRLSADRVIVGEVRGPEPEPMLNAMSKGNERQHGRPVRRGSSTPPSGTRSGADENGVRRAINHTVAGKVPSLVDVGNARSAA